MEDIDKGWECELLETKINRELDEFKDIVGKDERKEAVNIHLQSLLCEMAVKFKDAEITEEEYIELKDRLRRKAGKIINGKG